MVQRVSTVAFEGIEARAVDVQVQVAPGLPAFAIVGLAREAAAIFGGDRIIFGSNLPVSTLSTDFRGIVEVMLQALQAETTETLAKFFALNAIRFYRIPIDRVST